MCTEFARSFATLMMALLLTLGFTPEAGAQNAAAATTVANGATCTAASNMYWEIGDLNGVIVSGRRGLLAPQRTTDLLLASASKWILGAYLLEVHGGPAPQAQRDAARMLSGYPQFDYSLCATSDTVADCFHRIGNHSHDPALDGHFYYSGGNSQYLATDSTLLDLGLLTTAELSQTMQSTLGISMAYDDPTLSAMLKGSAASYAEFLKKLMKSPQDGGLVMHDYLGHDPVATLPCPTGHGGCTPGGNAAWHYGDHYWIEDNADPGEITIGSETVPVLVGDGAFSSLGAFGFYPWISADKQYYGIIARRTILGSGYLQSIKCGQAIRQAFFSSP